MTRLECEKKLLSLAEQMRAVYLEYNPAGDFMSAIIDADGYINVNDCLFNADRQIITNEDGTVFRSVNTTKFSNGDIRYGCPVKKGAE